MSDQAEATSVIARRAPRWDWTSRLEPDALPCAANRKLETGTTATSHWPATIYEPFAPNVFALIDEEDLPLFPRYATPLRRNPHIPFRFVSASSSFHARRCN